MLPPSEISGMGLIARIAVCQNLLGEGQYVPAEDTGDERCFMPGCGCTPVIYVREDNQRGAVEALRETRAFLDTRHTPSGELARPANLIARIDAIIEGR